MSAGLFGLLDDVAALARITAASVDDLGAAAGRASVKAAGVVVDDTAVTPQYVQGVAAQRELPIVKQIAVGSLRNKLLFILPAALLLSELAPHWVLPLILVCGGTFLAYEGAEKILEALTGHRGDTRDQQGELTPERERALVGGAVRTDFILSAEIMVIALNEVTDSPLVARAIILAVVAVAITLLVYGVVALIVKMDDAGLALAQRSSTLAQRVGHALVAGMPRLLSAISIVGIAAMLWVGGHILLAQLDELGWHPPYDAVHHLEHEVHDAVDGVGGVLGWLVNTACSALVGLVVGAVAVAVSHLIPTRHGEDSEIAP